MPVTEMRVVRNLVPRIIRHSVSAQLARAQAARLRRDLRALASGTQTIVVGPWLGEVGFELLYWAPFLGWFAEEFRVDPERLLVVSRGGTASWYRPFAAGYREIFDYLSPDTFRERHHERVTANGEQKQTRVLAFEHELLQRLTSDVRHRAMLHPSTMYRLFSPFWWGHVDESWVHRHARYRRLEPPVAAAAAAMPRPYVAAKFYFNDCFPATDASRAFVRRTLDAHLDRGPVVSLATGPNVDDHRGDEPHDARVRQALADVEPRDNLCVQSALVAGASEFVGTYGGFSYLAPFYGVPATAYYGDPRGFSARHLLMARSALRTIGMEDRLRLRSMQEG